MLKKFTPITPDFTPKDYISAVFQEYPEIIEILTLRIELEPDRTESMLDAIISLVEKLYTTDEYNISLEKRIIHSIFESHKQFIQNLQTTYIQSTKNEKETYAKQQDIADIDLLLSAL